MGFEVINGTWHYRNDSGDIVDTGAGEYTAAWDIYLADTNQEPVGDYCQFIPY